MNEHECKKFIKGFFITSAVLLILAAAVVVLADPYFHYHAPLPGLKPVYMEKEYQINGALEHLDYNAVLLGSSVTMNINSRLFDEAYGCVTEKAVASGARCSTLVYYLEKAFDNRDLEYVFWGLDPDQICYAVDPVPDQDQVLYLRDKNPFNDVNYLWSVDVLFEKVPNMIALSAHEDYDRGRAYDFAQYSSFGYEQALATHLPEGDIAEVKDTADEEFVRKINANMDLVEELVRSHPGTEFKFFFTVASVLWWDIHYRGGNIERYFTAWRNAVARLDKYENVSFYTGVFNDKEILMDLSRYCDYCHADYEVNCLQAESVINEDRLITMDNVDEEIEILRQIINDFEGRLIEEGNWDFLSEYTKK